MTTPTLTCDYCPAEIDTTADPRCIQQGGMDVMCAECRKRAWENRYRLEVEKVNQSTDREINEAFRIKRGWSA